MIWHCSKDNAYHYGLISSLTPSSLLNQFSQSISHKNQAFRKGVIKVCIHMFAYLYYALEVDDVNSYYLPLLTATLKYYESLA